MPIVILEGLSVLVIAVIFYALISGFSRWKVARDRSSLIVWAGLVAALFALNPESRIVSVPVALVAAYTVSRYTKAMRMNPDEPTPLLLQFCTYRSAAETGSVAGLMVVVLLYTLGLLQSHDFWVKEGLDRVGNVVVSALLFGGALGALRKVMRSKWPHALFVPYTFTPGGSAVHTREGEGFRADELVLPLVATPFIWLFLGEIHPGWSTIFLFGLMLPSFGFYLLWAFFHTTWLRWIGTVNGQDRAVFRAYEVLIKDQSIQPWLGDVLIEFDPQERVYVVAGTLPGHQEKATVRRRLQEIDADCQVRDDAVRLDDELTPNPWYERAIEKQKRKKRESA